MSALDRQVGGDHYKNMPIQPWEAIRAWLSPEQFKGYMLGTAIAYIARVNAQGVGKGGDSDIAKALHTLEFYTESTTNRDKAADPLEELMESVERMSQRDRDDAKVSAFHMTEDGAMPLSDAELLALMGDPLPLMREFAHAQRLKRKAGK